MSVNVGLALQGDAELLRAFNALDDKIQKKVTRKGFRAGGRILLNASKAAAAPISSRLAKSLKLRALKRRGKRGKGKLIGVVVITPKKEVLGIASDAKGYWPAHVEMGFKHRGGQHIPARSFLRRPAIRNEARVFAATGQEIKRVIEEIWRTRR